MDQEVIAVISAVIYLVLAKRHIANHAVKKTVRELRFFEALNSNLIFLVQLSCDPA